MLPDYFVDLVLPVAGAQVLPAGLTELHQDVHAAFLQQSPQFVQRLIGREIGFDDVVDDVSAAATTVLDDISRMRPTMA